MGRRAFGIAAALALEVLLILLLLTLSRAGDEPAGSPESLVSFDVGPPPAEAEADTPEPEQQADQPAEEAQESVEPTPPTPAPPVAPRREQPLVLRPPDVAIVPLSRDEMASADVAAVPRPPSASNAPAYGPSMPSSPGDSQVVGRAPNGEPLYAARWYREPTDGELRGYLSTASGPGWALIACRTAPGWRVEDCVGLEESPPGSNLERAVLAAAWQFQVRPPRRAGESLVGSWVRIRIDYGMRTR